jgi:hypothetical protein
MANCMIQSKNMAPSFWVEAVNCANYIQNRMPHRVVLHKTPEESWSHVKPDDSSFRVFGSPAWALIPVKKHKAMEKKSQPLIFVGYCEDIKAYRLFEPITKEVFFRRAIRFDEGFNPTSNPSPSSYCHVDNCVEHIDKFSLEDDNEPFEVQHQPELSERSFLIERDDCFSTKALKFLKVARTSLLYLRKYTQERREKSSMKVSAYLAPENE